MTKTTEESKHDVPLQGLLSVYVMCLKYNYRKEADWCGKAFAHMKGLREENARLRGEANYSVSKPTNALEQYKNELPQETKDVFDLTSIEKQIRKEERERCAKIVRAHFVTEYPLGPDNKGYYSKSRADAENEKIEKIALAVERG